MSEASVAHKGAWSWLSRLQTGWRGARKLAGRVNKRLRHLKKAPLIDDVRDRINKWRAELRRPRLDRVTFVGVTGSCAKTTTCILTKAILLRDDTWRRGSAQNVAQAILSADPSSRFCIQELSADRPGKIAEDVALLKPGVAIVTVVGSDHYKHYRGPSGAAREKGRLVEALPETGIAVLNADDPHVLALAARTSARVVTFGRSPLAEVRAMNISSNWPNPLTLVVARGEESVAVKTQFYGEHWATAFVASIACGLACGRSLKDCATATEEVTPLFGRYSAHHVPNGSSYVLDSFKSSSWTVASGLDFVRNASATRKTIVIGTITDYAGNGGRTHRKIAREALKVADRVALVGGHASYIDKLRSGADRDRLFGFMSSFQASAFLADTALPGELIYVKGNSSTDHLERLMLAQLGEVVCWREGCRVKGACPKCLNYRKPSRPPLGLPQEPSVPDLETSP